MRGCQEKMAGYMRDLHIMGKVSKQVSYTLGAGPPAVCNQFTAPKSTWNS